MASSGVWENVILSKTPTLDGVCGLLFFTILIFWELFCQMLAYLPVCYVGRWHSQLFNVDCDRCYCHQLFVNHLMLLADVICHVVVIWLMIFAIVADGIATFLLLLWQMKNHISR